MFFRLMCLFALVLAPALSHGMEAWEDIPGSCRLDSWNDVDKWRDWNSQSPMAANWTEERPRFANNREVWRWHDRLYISVMDGKVLVLADCSFGDASHYYEYERFDEPGGFHVVHLWQYEAHSYALVRRDTGKICTVAGLPVRSPNGARYAYAACLPPDGTTDIGEAEIGIFGIADSRPEVLAKAEMPCGDSDCTIEWDGEESVRAVCQDNGSSSTWMTQFLRTGNRWTTSTSKR